MIAKIKSYLLKADANKAAYVISAGLYFIFILPFLVYGYLHWGKISFGWQVIIDVTLPWVFTDLTKVPIALKISTWQFKHEASQLAKEMAEAFIGKYRAVLSEKVENET
jgi:hypothetical protein